MPQIWGLNNDTLSEELVEGSFVSIGWDEIGDLSELRGGREGIKKALRNSNPDRKPRSIAGNAGVLYRFLNEMKSGDIILAPFRRDSTINLGIIQGDYYFEADAETHRHRRPIRWVKIGLPRAVFSQSALYEFGSAITLFKIQRHANEVETAIRADTDDADLIADKVDDESAAITDKTSEEENTQPRASLINRHTRDFVLEVLSAQISPRDFEEFSADLLRSIGYQARVTQYSQDGGVDVIAHKDPLGIEPPLIKVQCKKKVSTIGAPEVQQLIGTKSEGELLLFFTLGAYSKDALAIERQQPGLRLLSGEDIVTLFLDNYDRLPERWRRLIPLTPVLVVSDEVEQS